MAATVLGTLRRFSSGRWMLPVRVAGHQDTRRTAAGSFGLASTCRVMSYSLSSVSDTRPFNSAFVRISAA